ncbi:MAG: cupin domain-containing protein [Candidatus Omnitrophica bacterium]|nr:cupin domain-containing protein [Candidatus Omnitrophota bacterium]
MLSKILVNNYYTGFAPDPLLENFKILLFGKKFNLEKIISKGYATPAAKWIIEETNEFVLLLKGKAELVFEDEQKIKLTEGDYFVIPKKTKHKVTRTSRRPLCYWLTIHYK